jgi:alpha,alpha-trehalase
MVIKTSKKLASRIPRKLPKLRRSKGELTAKDVEAAREYISGYWPKLTRYHPKDDESLLGLPHRYLVPAFEEGHEFDFNELYYWDSYFMMQGLLDEKHKDLVIGMVENLLFTFERFKIIPNASRTYLMGRSQPPFLTSFILDIYKTYKMDKPWLKRAIKIAQAEYRTVWTGKNKPNARLVHEGLSRYYDINYLHDLAEAESGWDYTPPTTGALPSTS